MAFRDLDDFLVVKPVELPIRGKVYAFPGEITAEAWLLLQIVAEQMERAQKAQAAGLPIDEDEEAVDDHAESRLRSELLGGVEQEMIEDGLTSAHLKAVFYTLIAFHLSGLEAAEAVWEAQGETSAPNRATRRAKSPRGASPTRSRGSQGASKAPKAE